MGTTKRLALLLVFLALMAAGCQRDKPGRASILAQTTLPGGFNITLINVDKPKTLYQQVHTDVGGNVRFFGLEPGRYKLEYQALTGQTRPSDTGYNYGESETLDVKPGQNSFNWSVETGSVTRLDD